MPMLPMHTHLHMQINKQIKYVICVHVLLCIYIGTFSKVWSRRHSSCRALFQQSMNTQLYKRENTIYIYIYIYSCCVCVCLCVSVYLCMVMMCAPALSHADWVAGLMPVLFLELSLAGDPSSLFLGLRFVLLALLTEASQKPETRSIACARRGRESLGGALQRAGSP